MNYRLVDTRGREPLTPQQKLELVHGMNSANNVAEYAREVGVDRSYLYQLRREMEEGALQAWTNTVAGRPANSQPLSETLEQQQAEIARLDEQAKIWEARAVVATWILGELEKMGAVKKTSPEPPIFWRR